MIAPNYMPAVGFDTNGLYKNRTGKILVVIGLNMGGLIDDVAIDTNPVTVQVFSPDGNAVDTVYVSVAGVGTLPTGGVTVIMLFLPKKLFLPPGYQMVIGSRGTPTSLPFQFLECDTVQEAASIL